MPSISTWRRHSKAKNLQFYVNTEIGSLSAGSASIAGTKDASFPGEYGQVGSYVTGVKMVLPSGELLEVTEDAQPDLMQKLRSSYGLFGIVYEVTYKIKPLTPMHVHHETFSLEDFITALPDLKALRLLDDVLHVSVRRQNHRRIPQIQSGATGEPNHAAWALRNHIWGTSDPSLGIDIRAERSIPSIRYGIIDAFNAAWRLQLETIVIERLHHSTRPDHSATRRSLTTAATPSASSHFPKTSIPQHSPISANSARITTSRRAIAPTCCMWVIASRRTRNRCSPIPTMAP